MTALLLTRRLSPEILPVLIIALCVYQIWWIVKESRFLLRTKNCSDILTGTVTSLAEASRGRHGSLFVPVIRYTYTGRDGQEHTEFYEPDHSYPYDKFAVGTEVYLFRDPEDGTNVYLAGEKQTAWRTILIPSGLILALLLIWILTRPA